MNCKTFLYFTFFAVLVAIYLSSVSLRANYIELIKKRRDSSYSDGNVKIILLKWDFDLIIFFPFLCLDENEYEPIDAVIHFFGYLFSTLKSKQQKYAHTQRHKMKKGH